jgi:hypothetical protein
MFLKVNEVRMPAWDTSMRRDDPRQPKAKTEFDQYTFSLFATDAGRSALRFYEDDVPQDVFYGGGSSTTVLANVALIATTIIAAVVSSART